jgi:arsenical pump membrane protein
MITSSAGSDSYSCRKSLLPERPAAGRPALNAAVAIGALILVLAWAVIRPRGWPEAVAAVPAAVAVICTGAIPPHAALAEVAHLGPVIGFLAAVLVLAQMCEDEGLFHACGEWMARRSGGGPSACSARSSP